LDTVPADEWVPVLPWKTAASAAESAPQACCALVQHSDGSQRVEGIARQSGAGFQFVRAVQGSGSQ
jgi:hypothetical protein